MGTNNLEHFNDQHPLMKIGFRVEKPRISSSSLQDYYRCARYFMFRYRLGLVRLGLGASALIEGQWVHETLRSLSVGGDLNTIDRDLQLRISALCQEATDDQGVLPAGFAEGLERAKTKAVAMGWAFRELIEELGLPVYRPDLTKTLYVEQQVLCNLPLANKELLLAGTLDLVTMSIVGDVVTINDYKRVGNSLGDWAKVARLEPQAWFYPLLLKSLWSSLPDEPGAQRFCHWLIQAPTIHQRKVRQPETFPEYCERVKGWYKEKAVENRDDPPIQTSTQDVELPLVTKAREKMLLEVNAASTYERVHADDFPMTGATRSCKLYGRLCPYEALCTRDPALWPDEILNHYKQEFRYDNDESGVGD